jgi:hypothetical protein
MQNRFAIVYLFEYCVDALDLLTTSLNGLTGEYVNPGAIPPHRVWQVSFAQFVELTAGVFLKTPD